MPKYGKIRGAIRWYSRLPNLRKPIFAPIYSRLLTWVNTVYRGSGGRYSRYFAGGFVLRRCRNSIRRYSAAPKREFRSQFPLFPLYSEIVHWRATWCAPVRCCCGKARKVPENSVLKTDSRFFIILGITLGCGVCGRAVNLQFLQKPFLCNSLDFHSDSTSVFSGC